MTCAGDPTVRGFPTTIIRGDTVRFSLYISVDDCPVDISGWDLWLILRDSINTLSDDSLTVRLTAPTDEQSAAGVAVITLHSTCTANIPAGRYFLELKRVLPDTVPADIWTFYFDTKPNITVLSGTVLFTDADVHMPSPHCPVESSSGQAGPPGPAGLPGASAYDIWLQLGNVGTQQAFLDSLRSGTETSVEIDVSGSRYWYIRYTNKIIRLDLDTHPPTRGEYLAEISQELWLTRTSLAYL